MAIAWVQSVSAQGGFGNVVTTAGITTTNGNLVLLDNQASQTFTSNTDFYTNAWTANSVPEVTNIAGVNGRENYNVNIAGGAGHTFTGNYSTNGFPVIAATEYSGHSATPIDVVVSATTAFSTAHSTGATATVGANTKIVHGFMCTNNGQNNTPDAWTQRHQAAIGVIIATTAASSGNTYTYDSTSPAPDGSVQWAVALIEASAGGSVITAAGASTVTVAGASSASVALTSAGAAAVTLRSQSTAQTVLTSAGASTVVVAGSSTASGAISSAGAAVVNLVGTTLGVTGAAISIAGAATVNLAGAAVTGAAVTSAGASTVVLKGSTAGGVDVTLWGRYPLERKKRLEQEEAEIMQYLNTIAPELIRRVRQRR